MARHNELGKWGEEIACELLVKQGFAIAERNWRMGHLEIDIVAVNQDCMVFVEVKTRADDGVDPLDAIDNRKIAAMAAAADAYLKHHEGRRHARFDVVGISGTPANYRVEHIPDAFWPPLKSYN